MKPTESKIDHGVGMREPDGLAKATDMRMEHQFLRAPVSEGKGFNRCTMWPPIHASRINCTNPIHASRINIQKCVFKSMVWMDALVCA